MFAFYIYRLFCILAGCEIKFASADDDSVYIVISTACIQSNINANVGYFELLIYNSLTLG